jgi:hypothetical protein
VLDSETFRNPINELPHGSVQMYLRDPSGNLVELDWPAVTTRNTARIPEPKKRADLFPQQGENLQTLLDDDRQHRQPNRRRN